MSRICLARAEGSGGVLRYLAAATEGLWHDVTASWTTWAALVAATHERSFSQRVETSPVADLGDNHWNLRMPFEPPARFYGVALNYESRAVQVSVNVPSEPFIFTKEPSCLAVSGHEITIPADVIAHLEGEVAAVVTSVDGSAIRAAGRLAVNDMTFPERLGPPPGNDWFAGKNLPASTTLGPWLVIDAQSDGYELASSQRTLRNGSQCQSARWTDMCHRLDVVIDYLSARVVLCPGDIISLGTPRNDLDGTGQLPLADGDYVEIQIDGIPSASFSVKRSL